MWSATIGQRPPGPGAILPLSGSTVGIALYTAIGIAVLAALYPCARAALLRPGVALRRE